MSQISFLSAGDKEAVLSTKLHIKNLTLASPENLVSQVVVFSHEPGILLHFPASMYDSEWHGRIL